MCEISQTNENFREIFRILVWKTNWKGWRFFASWTSYALQVGNPFEHEKYYRGSVNCGKILVLNYSDVISSVFINGFLCIRKIVTVIWWPCASTSFGGPHGGGGYKTESDLRLCRWFSCCRPWLCICLWHLYTKTCEYSDSFAVGCSEFLLTLLSVSHLMMSGLVITVLNKTKINITVKKEVV